MQRGKERKNTKRVFELVFDFVALFKQKKKHKNAVELRLCFEQIRIGEARVPMECEEQIEMFMKEEEKPTFN